jgi:hypothetical protein
MQIAENAILSVTLYATQDSFCGEAQALTAGFSGFAAMAMVEDGASVINCKINCRRELWVAD